LVGGIYMLSRKTVEEFKPKPTGRIRSKPTLWRIYRAGAKVYCMEIQVRVRSGQQEQLAKKLDALQENQQHLFPGTMQRYVFEDEADSRHVTILLIWKDTEMPDEATMWEELA